MDAWYVDERRFLLDVKILALTARQLIQSLHVCRGSDAMPIDDLDVERRLKRDSSTI
jgi:hypothetical protein